MLINLLNFVEKMYMWSNYFFFILSHFHGWLVSLWLCSNIIQMTILIFWRWLWNYSHFFKVLLLNFNEHKLDDNKMKNKEEEYMEKRERKRRKRNRSLRRMITQIKMILSLINHDLFKIKVMNRLHHPLVIYSILLNKVNFNLLV